MKLESDPGHGVQSPSRKSFNPFDSDDEHTNSYIRTNVNYDIKSFEKNAESLTFHLDTADLTWEEAILAHAQVADHKINEDINRKDTEVFTDKTVTECDLPELILCFKDNAYNSVKDIGIDEGVPSPTHEKACVKTRDSQETKILPTLLDDLGLENEDSMKEGSLDSEVFERQQCGTDGTKKVDEFKEDLCKIESDSCGKITGNETKIESQLTVRDDLSKIESESSEEPSIAGIPEIMNDSNKTINELEEASSSESRELQETAESSTVNVLSYNSKVESGSIVLDFKSLNEETELESEEIETVVSKPPVSQTMSRVDPSASITYTGLHAHTGSVSLRSESSAGSTRSFAFPVLQAEWNSSPVRMAKAEQRHMRKHRGWFSSLVCCRFGF